MAKSTRKSEFNPCKDQLRDLCNYYLNQKITTAINTLDGSKLGANLISTHQVDYLCVLSAHSSWNYWT